LVPVIVTLVPPPVPPDVGDSEVTVGTDAAVYVKLSAVTMAEVPAWVVTVISTTPAGLGGEVAVIEVLEFTM